MLQCKRFYETLAGDSCEGSFKSTMIEGGQTMAKSTAKKTSKSKAGQSKASKTKSAQSKPQHLGNMETIMTQGTVNFEKYASEAGKIGQDHMEAYVESGNIFFKGCETIMKTYWDMTQEVAEKNNQAFKELMGCKTLNDYTDVQNKLAQQSFDDFMTSATKISELSVKLATEAFQPINDQLGKSIQKATQSMAA